jgi:ubiquinone/menaquinone biosynthesis C-methylase UbiE
MRMQDEARLQRKYYDRTAAKYDEVHLGSVGAHDVACEFISALLPLLRVRSILDVGCGTGRAVSFFRSHNPEIQTDGIEPSSALLERAKAKLGEGGLFLGSGAQLPFSDNAYDVVVSTGVLHHVKDPDQVVREMLRVAGKAVFISDHNIFGQGGAVKRFTKWILYKGGLWTLVKRMLNLGKSYHVSEGDGVAFSYSVYFQYSMLQEWAPDLFVVPTRVNRARGLTTWSPVFNAEEVLLCAIKLYGPHGEKKSAC